MGAEGHSHPAHSLTQTRLAARVTEISTVHNRGNIIESTISNRSTVLKSFY
jgi:hypothetical protein